MAHTKIEEGVVSLKPPYNFTFASFSIENCEICTYRKWKIGKSSTYLLDGGEAVKSVLNRLSRFANQNKTHVWAGHREVFGDRFQYTFLAFF